MTLFGKKTKEEIKEEPKTILPVLGGGSSNGPHVIVNPRVTEKAHDLAEKKNVFVFNVTKDATKGSISDTIKSMYKVVPVKVSIVTVPKKRVVSRGKVGFRGRGRKAYVYLKKGEKIEVS